MRPEAWALAGLYALYLWRGADDRERLRYAGLTALAPVLWALADWLVTGDALHSLHGTADLAETADRRRDPLTGPYWTAKYFGYALREPLVIGVPIGLAFAWRHARGARVLPLAGRGGDARRVPRRPAVRAAADRPLRAHAGGAAGALLRARGVGWRMLPREARDRRALGDRRRRRGAAVGRLPALAREAAARASTNRLDLQGAYYRDLRAVGEAPAVRAAFDALRHDRHRRPPPDPASALVARGRPGQRRAGRHARRRAARACCCSPAAPARCSASTRRSSRA